MNTRESKGYTERKKQPVSKKKRIIPVRNKFVSAITLLSAEEKERKEKKIEKRYTNIILRYWFREGKKKKVLEKIDQYGA
jgi:hypothetical protein